MTRSPLAGLAALAAVAGFIATPLHGQQPEEQEPDTVYQIEPIMVRVLGSTIGTATPYPVSVLAGSELTRGTPSAFIEDAVRAVPGIQVQNRYNLAVGERLSIRGFGPRSQFGVRGIRVLVDGIPATLPDGQATLDHLDLAGLGRVEAIRGPAAAAYGNAAGGVLHFRTTDPALVPAQVSVRSASGSNGLWTAQAHATGTQDDVGYRVGASRLTYDGFRRDPIADDGSVYGGGTRYIGNATVTLPALGGEMRIVANGMDLDAQNPGSLPADRLEEGDRAAWGFNIISGASKEVRQGQLGATWTGDVADRELQVAGWWIGRDLWNPIPGRIIALVRNAGGVRALYQGRTDMSAGSFGWRFGAEAELQYDDRENLDNDGGDPGELLLDQNERVRGLGVFAQGRLDLSDRISILAGARFDDVYFAVDDHFVQGGDPDDTGSRSMNAFSPSVGVVFKPGDNAELFGSVSKAFETPTTTELANRPTGSGGFNPSLDPQESVTIEGGARTRLAGRVALELSIFNTQLTNGLVPFEVASDPGRTYFRNAGQADHTGYEISADGELVTDASLRVAYTRVNAEYVEFRPGGEIYDGNKIPGLAPRRFDGVLSYTPGNRWVEVRGLWQDDVPVDDAGTARADSYFVLDANAGMGSLPVGGLSLAPFVGVENILDTDYVASVVPNAFGDRFFEPGPGRTYRLGLGVTWGY